RVALTGAVSAEEAAALTRIAPDARVAVVPNGVDVAEFSPGAAGGRGVAYVGGLHWFPNVDALEYFAHDGLPHLRAARPDVPVRWIGSATAEQRLRYMERSGIDITGYVDDVRPAMREAACHVVPLRAGGGTRLKILNSWG